MRTQRSRTMAYRYTVALIALAIAAAARMALRPILGDGQPFVTFLLAMALVATTQGFGPAMVVLVGAEVLFPLMFRHPDYSFALPSAAGLRHLASFALIGILISAMCAALRLAWIRSESGRDELRREIALRELAESALRESETRWRALIENSSDAITMISPEGKILYISASVRRLTGCEPEELIGEVGAEFIHPDDRKHADRAWAEVLARPGEGIASEFRLRHKDGTWRNVENVATNHLDDPAIGAIVINTRDVTERSAIQERLRRSEARFRSFMDHSPTLAYLKDESGRYVWGNRAWAEQFGRRLDDLAGRDDYSLWPRGTADTFRASDRLALNSGQGIEVVESIGERHFMSLKFPVEDGGATLIGGQTLDVTDRVEADQKLRRSESLLLALADSMPQIVFAADARGQTDYFNRRWFEYTGFTEDESFINDGWAAIIHPDDRARCKERWYASISSGEPYEIEYRFKDRANGGYRWQLGRALPVRDEGGRIIRWYGTCTDIDDQKRAEAAAEGANQAKDRFLAVLSHELRTPLTPIMLSVSSLLEDADADLGETQPALELIRRNVALESRLIDDLLDVMRIVRGKFSLNIEACDAHELIGQALEICRGDLEAAGATVEVDLAATDPSVVADPARLQQVFWNLIKNAAKFSPGGGPIAIRTRGDEDSGRLIVEVADAGVGIAPEFLPKVFEAFEQGELSPWTRKFGGLGLGLAISRAIVTAHSGEITATSEGQGRGSTFRVTLPTAAGIARPASLGRDESASLRGSPSHRTLRILLIEDDASTLRVLSQLLRLDRHEVTTAESVSAALAAADRAGHAFDLIISDIGLPDGNGVDLMRALQARRACPAIALTGFGMDDDVRKGRDAGFRAHLTKPVDFRTLEATIREVVASPSP